MPKGRKASARRPCRDSRHAPRPSAAPARPAATRRPRCRSTAAARAPAAKVRLSTSPTTSSTSAEGTADAMPLTSCNQQGPDPRTRQRAAARASSTSAAARTGATTAPTRRCAAAAAPTRASPASSHHSATVVGQPASAGSRLADEHAGQAPSARRYPTHLRLRGPPGLRFGPRQLHAPGLQRQLRHAVAQRGEQQRQRGEVMPRRAASRAVEARSRPHQRCAVEAERGSQSPRSPGGPGAADPGSSAASITRTAGSRPPERGEVPTRLRGHVRRPVHMNSGTRRRRHNGIQAPVAAGAQTGERGWRWRKRAWRGQGGEASGRTAEQALAQLGLRRTRRQPDAEEARPEHRVEQFHRRAPALCAKLELAARGRQRPTITSPRFTSGKARAMNRASALRRRARSRCRGASPGSSDRRWPRRRACAGRRA